MNRVPASREKLSLRIVIVIIVISLLCNSVLAAPEAAKTVLVSADQLGEDIRFAYLSNNIFGSLANDFLLFVKGKRTGQNSAQLSSIEIVPGGDITIKQEEPIDFAAVGYDLEGHRISRLRFRWTVQDIGRNQAPRNLPDGIFPAKNTGSFIVTARTGGMQAQVNVTVRENRPLRMMKRIKEREDQGDFTLSDYLRSQHRYSTEEISSRGNVRNNLGKGSNESPQSEISSNQNRAVDPSTGMTMRPIDEDGWNSTNWHDAQDPGNQTGNPPGTSPDSGSGNGNFQFSAPVVSLPGRGIDISLSLNYNSRVWSKSGNEMIFDAERGFPAPGWDLGFGKMMFMGATGGCMLIDADGTKHGYTGNVSTYGTTPNITYNFVGHTADGTMTDYSCNVTNSLSTWSMSGLAKLSNGTVINYFVQSSNGKQAFPTQITDAQGNYINIVYQSNHGPELKMVTDTVGRELYFNYDSQNRLVSVDVPQIDGNLGEGLTRTAVRLHYKPLALQATWLSPLTSNTNNSTPDVIDAIYYPGTGTGYWFNDTDSYSTYGMIAKVLEQRGMTWSSAGGTQGTVTAGTMTKQAVYDYPLTPNNSLTDAPTYASLSESWDGMDTSSATACNAVNTTAAVTCYSVNMNPGAGLPRTIIVTQPNGVKSKQYIFNTTTAPTPDRWKDGLLYKDETLNAASSVLTSSQVTWETGAYDSPRPNRTDVTDENGHIVTTTYSYGASYNQITSQKTYDYDANVSTATPLKEVRTTYENNASYVGNGTSPLTTGQHIFNLAKTTEVYDGSNNRLTKTDYEYDYNAVVNGTGNATNLFKQTDGVTMHKSSFDPFTTDTVDGDCIAWDTEWCDNGPEQPCGICIEWEQVNAYVTNTIFRGNLTKTTVYSDASPTTPTGAISQTKKYDVTGNIVEETASCCELKTYDYTLGTQYAYPTTLTRGSSDPNSTLRNTSTAVYDMQTGLLIQSTDPNGRTNYTAYDALTLRPIQSTTSTGAYTQTTYSEPATGSITVTDVTKEANGTLASKTVTYLNGLGQAKREDSIGPSNVTDIVESKYDQLGRPWKQSRPYRTGDTIQWSEKFYDIQGRLTKIVGPDGSETKAFYNENQRPDSASNLAGNTIRVMDAWGRERWGRYDSQERLAEVVEPNPSGNGSVFAAGSMVTNYSYDKLGRLVQSDQGGQLRKFAYDSLGRVTRQKLAEQSATLNTAGVYVGEGGLDATWSSATFYDNRSNVIQRVDPRGVKVNYSYQISGADDPLNRIQAVSYDLTGPHDTSKPIAAAPTVTYEYMTAGDQDRLKKAIAVGISTEELTYDIEGRVTDYTQTIDSRTSYPWVTSYAYDTLSRVTQMRYPAAYGLAASPRKLIENTFDVSSRLTSLKVDNQVVAGNIVYDASDQTTSINIGTAGTNQINEQYTFDAQTGLLTNQKAIKNGTTTLLDLTYDYNRNNSSGSLNGKTGHLTKILNNLDHNKDREYKFDAIGRLTMAIGKATGGRQWTQTYVYDRFGNRTSVTPSGRGIDNAIMTPDGIPTLAYNTANNRITTSGFEYDVAGNQTRAIAEDGVTWLRYEYDAANRLCVVRRDDTNQTILQAFQYGSSNARLIDYDATSGFNKFYAGSGGTVLVEYIEYVQNIPSWSKSYTYLGNNQLSTITPNGAGGEYVEYNHPDQLGTRLMTNQSTGTVNEQAHLPFGKALNSESTVTNNNKRFTSYDRSAVTGLDYAVNRTYDSKQGRFTQVDPIGMGDSNLANPQSFNLYSYCQNDPINHTDPSGLGFFSFFKKLFRWIVAAIAVIVAIIVIAAIIAATGPVGVAGLLGIISVGSGATSSVLSALGYNTAAKIVGFIGIAAGIGAAHAAGASLSAIIKNFAERMASGSVWQRVTASANFNFVGGIANSFGPDKKKKRETAAQRRSRLISSAVNSVLWRLKNIPGCKDLIEGGPDFPQGKTKWDAEATLKTIHQSGGIVMNNNIQLTGETVGSGTGPNATIEFKEEFFGEQYAKGNAYDLNTNKARQLLLLHELRHANVGSHVGIYDGEWYNDHIAATCFGLKTKRTQ